VLFSPNLVATQWVLHTNRQVVPRVPFGSVTGPVQVVTGVNAAAIRDLQDRIDRLSQIDSSQYRLEVAQLEFQKQSLLAQGRSAPSLSVRITFGFFEPVRPVSQLDDAYGVPVILGRLIVDLVDFQSFNAAIEIGRSLNADLVGYFPYTNSYVFDLRQS